MNQNFLKKFFPILIILSLITGNLVLAKKEGTKDIMPFFEFF